MTAQPPINESQAHAVKQWLLANYAAPLNDAVKPTPFDIDIVCGIAGKEAACYWLAWTKDGSMTNTDILARCVFDASGDAPHAPRDAFPRNTAAFRERMGDDLTNLLIVEANKTRKLRGFGPKDWVYKGYGIFQYDLQYVLSDALFFKGLQWNDFNLCISRAMQELMSKYRIYKDIRTAVRAYNGSGPRAEQYAEDVMQLAAWCSEV
jgi:hypothetical protein